MGGGQSAGGYYGESAGERAKREELERLEAEKERKSRERLERRWKFRRSLRDTAISLIPLFLILLSLICVFAYHSMLVRSVKIYQSAFSQPGASFDNVLQQADPTQVPEESLLMLLYLGIFATAEAVFVLMAMKEYLQDYLKLDDETLINGRAEIPPEAMEAMGGAQSGGGTQPDEPPGMDSASSPP
jgi:hypothetical protein